MIVYKMKIIVLFDFKIISTEVMHQLEQYPPRRQRSMIKAVVLVALIKTKDSEHRLDELHFNESRFGDLVEAATKAPPRL